MFSLVITTAIKQMIRAVIFGAKLTTAKPLINITTEEREAKAQLEKKKKEDSPF